MKQFILNLILLFCLSYQVCGQSLINDIEILLIEDSIKFNKLELGFHGGEIIKSDDNRFHIFKLLILGKSEIIYFNSYFIYDRKNKEIHELEMERELRELYTYQFAKFYERKLILGQVGIHSDYHINEFNLNGKKTNSIQSIYPNGSPMMFPIKYPDKYFDLENNVTIWLEHSKMYLLNFENGEKILLAQISLNLCASGRYIGSPKIEVFPEDREIIISDYIDISDLNYFYQKSEKSKNYIKPVYQNKIVDHKMIFHY